LPLELQLTEVSECSGVEISFSIYVSLIAPYIFALQTVGAVSAALFMSEIAAVCPRRLHISEISSTRSIPNFELRYSTSNLLDYADSFMTESDAMGNEMYICTTKTGVGNFDQDFLWSQIGRELSSNFLHCAFDAAIEVVGNGCHLVYLGRR